MKLYGFTIQIRDMEGGPHYKKTCQEQRPGTDMLVDFKGRSDEVLLFSDILVVKFAAMVHSPQIFSFQGPSTASSTQCHLQ